MHPSLTPQRENYLLLVRTLRAAHPRVHAPDLEDAGPARVAEVVVTPHLDAGDFVVVVNAAKIRLTGNKESAKHYMSYSGWKGGEKYTSVAQLRASQPEKLIHRAVKGMIPVEPQEADGALPVPGGGD